MWYMAKEAVRRDATDLSKKCVDKQGVMWNVLCSEGNIVCLLMQCVYGLLISILILATSRTFKTESYM